ncbi:MAG: ABC transporter permease [Candidatus Cloacimonetes bacterium]|nr:ABC transporter permease [Candidatus Cloacimonadota bacterium]MBL7148994.1 ABC transporter permease [Candidatus Cloacimonadota bacterium]
MFINYVKIAFRNILRHKGFSAINILGFSLGLSVCILLLLWVQDEYNFDKFNSNFADIYRIMSYGTKYMQEGYEGTPGPLALTIKESMEEVEFSTRVYGFSDFIVRSDNLTFYEDTALVVDPDFFKIFDYPFLVGNETALFSGPFNIAISETIAQKYFGDKNPLGQQLQVDDFEMTVTAVFKDFPENSHLQSGFVVNWDIFRELGYASLPWGAFNYITYIKTKGEIDIEQMGSIMTLIGEKHECPQVKDGVSFHLQPLSEVHLDGKHGFYHNFYKLGYRNYIYIFSTIALLILFIACLNYINLSTARYENRAREVGLRKVIGATRWQLIFQFFYESVIFTILAVFISFFLIELLLPVFNSISGKEFILKDFLFSKTAFGIIGLVLITGIFSGFYPAIFLSSFKPVSVIKGSSFVNLVEGLPKLRKIMVVIQFTLSILLILCTAFIYKQIVFLQNMDIGFDTEDVIYIPLKGDVATKYDVVKQKFIEHPEILSVTAQDFLWAASNNRTTGVYWQGKQENYDGDFIIPRVDFDFFETLNIEFVEGRSFSEEFETDRSSAFILNETALKQMQIIDPIGKQLKLYGYSGLIQEGSIVGIFKDVNYGSLHNKIESQVIRVFKDYTDGQPTSAILLKTSSENLQETIAFIKSIWQEFNNDIPFEYNFLEKTYRKLYTNELQLRSILNYFTILAVFISCLGLYGLAAFRAEQRTKEIGIRKVMGASVSKLVYLLSVDFIKWVLIANIIACPIAWYAMNKWLKNYAYHTPLNAIIFILTGLMTFAIAFITVGYQTIKVANSNPVKALKYE